MGAEDQRKMGKAREWTRGGRKGPGGGADIQIYTY